MKLWWNDTHRLHQVNDKIADPSQEGRVWIGSLDTVNKLRSRWFNPLSLDLPWHLLKSCTCEALSYLEIANVFNPVALEMGTKQARPVALSTMDIDADQNGSQIVAVQAVQPMQQLPQMQQVQHWDNAQMAQMQQMQSSPQVFQMTDGGGTLQVPGFAQNMPMQMPMQMQMMHPMQGVAPMPMQTMGVPSGYGPAPAPVRARSSPMARAMLPLAGPRITNCSSSGEDLE